MDLNSRLLLQQSVLLLELKNSIGSMAGTAADGYDLRQAQEQVRGAIRLHNRIKDCALAVQSVLGNLAEMGLLDKAGFAILRSVGSKL